MTAERMPGYDEWKTTSPEHYAPERPDFDFEQHYLWRMGYGFREFAKDLSAAMDTGTEDDCQRLVEAAVDELLDAVRWFAMRGWRQEIEDWLKRRGVIRG